MAQVEEQKHKASMLQEELRETKIKLSRVTQEKLRMEREKRVARLAETKQGLLDINGTTTPGSGEKNVEQCKRKINELNSNIQQMNAVIVEKNRRIDEMGQLLDKSLTTDIGL